MLELEQALEKALNAIQPSSAAETTPIGDAVSRILAEDIVARTALPLFDNSAMDGWAVRSADVQTASRDQPVVLRCVAHVPAGSKFIGNVGAGECARIFTGSPLPAGGDAVVMQEDCRAELPAVFVMDAVKPWENVRFQGEDLKAGAVIAQAGDRLTATMAALCSACGVSTIQAKRQVRVAILATGSELKEPGAVLVEGEIYESNRILISALVRELGAEPIIKPIVPDDLGATINALREASEADAIITCGGVSVGEYDFVKKAIAQLGGNVDFWRVAIKPGKPFLHSSVLGKPLFGLPGNPVSALVTFWMLVRPALLKVSGATNLSPSISMGVLAEEISNRGDRRHFVRVIIDGEGQVRASGTQASHRLAGLAGANGLLDVPAQSVWQAGRSVSVICL